MKSYVEPTQVDGGNKRKKKESTSVRVNAKRRRGEPMHSVPMIDGASAQVRNWSYGNLSKRDASRFAKAVRFCFIRHYFYSPSLYTAETPHMSLSFVQNSCLFKFF